VIFARNEMRNDLSTAAMPIDLKAYTKDVEEQISQIHEDLAPFEAGKMTIGEREGNGPWRDVM
jgi:hypothetical protein